jgi:hypothetical protein
MDQSGRIKVSGALEGEFIVVEERSACEFVITRDTSWKAMLGEGERDASKGEVTSLEVEYGLFLSADGEG